MISRRLGASVVLAMVATVGLAFASPVGAQSTEHVQVEVVGGGPVFDFSQIYPGATLTSSVRVSNIGDDAGLLTVDAEDVVDESRCSAAETREGLSCGSGRGHLGEQVEFSIEHVTAGGEAEQVWSGQIDELHDVAMAPTPLEAGASADYRLRAHLPITSGNETQSDLLGFDLRFQLASETTDESATVLGSSVSRGDEVRVLGVTLPRTGADLARWGFLGGGGLLVGSLLTLVTGARARGR